MLGLVDNFNGLMDVCVKLAHQFLMSLMQQLQQALDFG